MKLNWRLSFPLLIIIALFQNSRSSVLLEDRFQSLENWVIVKSESDAGDPARVEIVRPEVPPPAFGPTVLELRGKILELFAKNLVVSDCMIELLWRDVDPVKADADGPLFARAQRPPDAGLNLPLPTGDGLYWLEHDSDAGFQLKLQQNYNQEKVLAMLNHNHKTTGDWNHAGWIWEKWLLQGNQLKATYWPSDGIDPGWLLEIEDSTFRFGGVGFRIWSGHAQIAFIRITELPDARPAPILDLNLQTLQTVFDRKQPVQFSLFVLPGSAKIDFVQFLLQGPAGVSEKWERPLIARSTIETLPFSWNSGDAIDGRYTLTAQVSNQAWCDSISFMIISEQETRTRLAQLEPQISALEKTIHQAAKQGLPTGYQTVTATGARHSLPLIEADLAAQKLQRARETVDFYSTATTQALAEIRQMQANPRNYDFLKFNSPSRFRLEIKNGGLYQQNQPVILTGLCGWNDVADDIPLYHGYGYNLAGLEIGPSSTVSGPGKNDLSEKKINEFLLPALKTARKQNVAVMLLVSPHYFPEWAFTAWPELKTCGHGFLKYCIENPHAREILARHLRFLISKIKNEPALHSYCLANEPQFIENCEFSRQKFQQFLRQKYLSIEKLNATWQSDYPDFSQIAIPTEINPPAVKYDWQIFHARQVTEFFGWMKSIIREEDPQRPVHIKFMMDVFDPGEGLFGIDREALGELCEISGCDAVTAFPDASGEFAADFLRQNMFYDLLRSFQPDKPIFNSEAHIIRDNDLLVDYPASYLRTSLWEATLHGQSASAIWVWAKNEVHPDLAGNLLHRPAANESAGRTALDLQRLAPALEKLARLKSPVALLYSEASKLLSGAHYLEELKKAYSGLIFQGLPVRFITEKQIEAGKLEQIKLLIVPGADFVPEATFEKVMEFTNHGGALLATANAFFFNEYGQSRARSEKIDALKLHLPDWPLAYANLNLHEIQRLSLPAPVSAKDYARLLGQVLGDLNLQPSVRVTNLSGENVRGVEVLCAPGHSPTLISVVNWLSQSVELRLSLPSGKSVRNLINNEIIVATHFTAHSMEPLLLEVQH